jgi:hypothetical protein
MDLLRSLLRFVKGERKGHDGLNKSQTRPLLSIDEYSFLLSQFRGATCPLSLPSFKAGERALGTSRDTCSFGG